MTAREEAVRRMERNRLFYEARRDELLREYPEQWVAIFDARVVGVDADFGRLLKNLRARGVPVEFARFEHLTTKDDILFSPDDPGLLSRRGRPPTPVH